MEFLITLIQWGKTKLVSGIHVILIRLCRRGILDTNIITFSDSMIYHSHAEALTPAYHDKDELSDRMDKELNELLCLHDFEVDLLIRDSLALYYLQQQQNNIRNFTDHAIAMDQVGPVHLGELSRENIAARTELF